MERYKAILLDNGTVMHKINAKRPRDLIRKLIIFINKKYENGKGGR
jgi:hypothetical protein